MLPSSKMIRGAPTRDSVSRTSASVTCSGDSARTRAASVRSSERNRSTGAAAAVAIAIDATASAANAARAIASRRSRLARKEAREEPAGALDVAAIALAVDGRQMLFFVARLDVHQREMNGGDGE